MKFVQIGILIALIAVGALLFVVWRGQQQQPTAMAPAIQETQPVAATPAAPPETPQTQPAQPAEKSAAKPSPAPRVRSATKPVADETTPEPVAADQMPVAAAPQAAMAPTLAAAPAPEAPAVPVEIPPPPPQPRTVTIPAGTLLPVSLAETLSSDKLQAGDAFTGTLTRPLVVEGLVIAERGARVDGRVVEAQQAGRVKGIASLAIQLVRLHTSDGQRVDIQTDAFHKAGETTKGEDAAKIGAGAGIGAVIGAIAGGGKGAAIGAAVGGAAGGGAVAATRGKPAVLPVETRIDFRLSSSVTLTEARR